MIMAEKTVAELREEERKNIEVATNDSEPEKTDEEADNEDTDDKGDEGKEIDKQEEKIEETENKEEQVENSEDKQKELEEQQRQAKTQEERDKFQKRIDREVAKRKALEDEIKLLRSQLAAQPEKTLTEEEVERRAAEKAAEKDAEREFTKACNRLADSGNKANKDFDVKIKDMADDIGPIPGQMIGILDDLENGAEVLLKLTEDHDLAEKMYSYSPAKLGVELTKLSASIKKPVETKQRSNAPKPPDPVGANGTNNNSLAAPLSDKDDIETWIAKRNKSLREKGKLHLVTG